MSTNPGFACRIDAKLEIVELSRSDDLDHGVPGVYVDLIDHDTQWGGRLSQGIIDASFQQVDVFYPYVSDPHTLIRHKRRVGGTTVFRRSPFGSGVGTYI